MSETHKLYSYDYEKLTIKALNKKCPRCGSNMAHHKVGGERWACGQCGLTEYPRATK